VPLTPDAPKFDALTEVAFVDDQVRSAEPLAVIDVGVALSVTVGSTGVTVTVAVAVAVVEPFFTVIV